MIKHEVATMMSKQTPFKTVLIGSTALIGGSLIAPSAALAAPCPSIITGTALAGIVCDFDNATGSSATVENGGNVGGISMNAYTPTSPSFILNASGGTINNTGGIGIEINSSSLSNGITNSGTITSSDSAIAIRNSSTIAGSLTNSGLITSSSGTSLVINNNSAITGGITNSGTIATSASVLLIDQQSLVVSGIHNSGLMISTGLGTGLRIANSSTITGGITNSGTITGSGVDSGIAMIGNSTVSGGIVNSGSINADSGDAIIMNSSLLNGDITNSSTINSANNVGIDVRNVSTITGNIANQTGGSISGGTDGIALRSGSMLSGGISNASGAAISGGTNGIAITSATVNGGISNDGTIFGGAIGISVFSTSIAGGITNNGTISGSTYSVGIDNTTTNFVNNGTITMNANNGEAIHNQNDGNTITNNGTIAYRIGTTGVSSTGNSNTLTNNGFMEVRHGIASNGTTNILTNNGTILSHGVLGGGLAETTAGNSQLTNNGTIIGTGDTSYGLKGVDGNLLTNNGYIRSTGPGILGVGDSMAVVNRGTIGNFEGITLTGNNNSVTLGMNSFTRGTVTFTGTANTLVYDVANVPRTGGVIYVGNTITGADTVTIANTSSLPADAKIAQNGNSVAVITPEQFAGTQQIVSQALTDVGTVLGNRQQLALLGDTTEAAGGTQYAASTATLSDSGDPNGWAVRDRKVAWAEGFGSYQERGSNGDMLDSKARAGGLVAGMDRPQSDSGYRSGVYVGGFMGTVDIGSSFRTIDSNGAMAGGYVGKSFGGTYVSGQMGFGFSHNESDRFTGVDTASADYNSYFMSPSFTMMHPVRVRSVTWVPSATMRYTAQFDESHTESGSAVNQSLDSHLSSSLDGRMMLEAKFDPSQWKYGTLKTSLRAGVEGQTLLGSNKVDMQVLGTNLSFDPKGGDGYVDGILGANLVHSVSDRLDLYGDAEATLGLNKGGAGSNKGAVGRIGARWKL